SPCGSSRSTGPSLSPWPASRPPAATPIPRDRCPRPGRTRPGPSAHRAASPSRAAAPPAIIPAMSDERSRSGAWTLPFLAGLVTATAGLVLWQALGGRRRLLDPRLIRGAKVLDGDIPPAVVVPGIMGSGLLRKDGTHVWLNLRNAVGQYNLSLPYVL